jgi:hypothetical protein
MRPGDSDVRACARGAADASTVALLNMREALLEEQWHTENHQCHPALVTVTGSEIISK